MAAAGYTLVDERMWQDRGDVPRASITYRSGRWTLVMVNAYQDWSDWRATWQVSED